jgi:opacity protein-like surface antigen
MQRCTRLAVLTVMTLGIACAADAYAADAPHAEITPYAGFRVGGQFDRENAEADRSVDVKDAASFGLDLGLYRDEGSFYELLYSRQRASLDANDAVLGDIDVRVEYLHFGGTLLFPQDAKWFVPYFSLTMGVTRFDAQRGDYDQETKFSASLGGGFRLPISDNVLATLGIRGYLTLMNSDAEFFCVSNGGATCLLRTSGSTFFQAEAQLGLTVRF